MLLIGLLVTLLLIVGVKGVIDFSYFNSIFINGVRLYLAIKLLLEWSLSNYCFEKGELFSFNNASFTFDGFCVWYKLFLEERTLTFSLKLGISWSFLVEIDLLREVYKDFLDFDRVYCFIGVLIVEESTDYF